MVHQFPQYGELPTGCAKADPYRTFLASAAGGSARWGGWGGGGGRFPPTLPLTRAHAQLVVSAVERHG